MGTFLANFVEVLSSPNETANADDMKALESFPPEVKMVRGYLQTVGKWFVDQCVPAKQEGTSAGQAFTAISRLMWRLQHVSDCRVLDFLIQNPDVKIDADKVLSSKQTKVLGHAVQTWNSVDAECKALEDREHDWKYFSEKLALVETLSLAIIDPAIKDSMFQHLHSSCELFVHTYLRVARQALDVFAPSTMEDLNNFITKYGPVVDCAENWQMGPVMYLYTEEHEGESALGLNMDAFMTFIQNVEQLCDSMKGLLGHSSSNDKLSALIADAGKFLSKARSSVKSAKKAAATTVMAGIVLNNEESKAKSEQIQEGLKLCHANFKMSKEDLPVKLQKLLADCLGDSQGTKSAKAKENKRAKVASGPDSTCPEGEEETKPPKKARVSKAAEQTEKPKKEKKEKKGKK